MSAPTLSDSPASPSSNDPVHRHRDSRGTGPVRHEVVAAAARHRVRAVGSCLLVEDVVAKPAGQRVAAGSTGQQVVSLTAGDRVVAGAAVEDVSARPTCDRVVAFASDGGVVATVTVHRQEEDRWPLRSPRRRPRRATSSPPLPLMVPSSTLLNVTSTSLSPFRLMPLAPSVIVSAEEPPITVTRSCTPVERSTTNSISALPEPSTAAPGANWPPLRSSVTPSAPVVPLTTIVSVFAVVAVPQIGDAHDDPARVGAGPDGDRCRVAGGGHAHGGRTGAEHATHGGLGRRAPPPARRARRGA